MSPVVNSFTQARSALRPVHRPARSSITQCSVGCTELSTSGAVGNVGMQRAGVFVAAPSCQWRGRSRSTPIAWSGSFDVECNSMRVVLTREQGKNDALRERLEEVGIETVEMPLIQTVPGPDADKLAEVLATEQFDWVALTSPEAAAVFAEGWRQAGKPEVRIAAVGHGTARALQESEPELTVAFIPKVANAEHFAPELPYDKDLGNDKMRVLYPASAKAATTLQEGLEVRAFEVTRLNTYNTTTVSEVDPDVLEQARQADAFTVASPSAVRALVSIVGEEAVKKVPVVCIGSTSARAAEKLGLKQVFWPEEPGIDGWVESVQRALHEAGKEVACELVVNDY